MMILDKSIDLDIILQLIITPLSWLKNKHENKAQKDT